METKCWSFFFPCIFETKTISHYSILQLTWIMASFAHALSIAHLFCRYNSCGVNATQLHLFICGAGTALWNDTQNRLQEESSAVIVLGDFFSFLDAWQEGGALLSRVDPKFVQDSEWKNNQQYHTPFWIRLDTTIFRCT